MKTARPTLIKKLTPIVIAMIALVASFSQSVPSARGEICGLDSEGSGDRAFDIVSQLSGTGLSSSSTIPLLNPPDPQSPDSGQSDSKTSAPNQPSDENQNNRPEDQNQPLKVNPLTGLVSTAGSDYQPLSGDERWKLYWKMNFFSVGAYFGPFFNALLLDQATGSPAQWGGGFKGYGRRVASRTASAILQGTFQAPAAVVLHEDVRYIASTQHGFKRRALHAIKYSFLTYNDHGRPTLNIANLGAYYASTAVSVAWLPGHHNVANYTLSNSSAQIGLTLPVNLLQEFWPEVRRYVLHRQ